MGGSTSTPSNTSTSTTQSPWQGAKPYLEGGSGTGPFAGQQHQGIFPLAEQGFNQFKSLSPQQQGLQDYYRPVLEDRYTDIKNFAYGKGNELIQGQYDPTFQAREGRTADLANMNAFTADPANMNAFTSDLANMNAFTSDLANMNAFTAGLTNMNAFTADMGSHGEGWVDPSTTNMVANRQALGELDPTQAMQQILSGQIDNPYLSAMHQANINTSLRGYDDAILSLTQNVLPQLGSQAFASGGYGGSRQGIAEGLALQQAQRNARDLGINAMDVGNQLYGGAYQSAQERMAQAAQGLNMQAADIGRFNAQQIQGADAANAAAYNQLMQFNAQQQQSASGTNAAAANALAQFNAQQQQSASGTNAAAANALAQFNAQQQQSASGTNAAAYNQLMQFNAQQQQAASGTNAAAYNQLQQFNAQQQQAASGTNAAAANALAQFNAGQLQNADQYAGNLEMQQQQQAVQNLLAGQGVYESAFGAADNIYNQLQSMYGSPQQQYLEALNQYASIVSPGAGMGGTTSTNAQVPIYSNTGAQVLGGASSIAGLLGSLR